MPGKRYCKDCSRLSFDLRLNNNHRHRCSNLFGDLVERVDVGGASKKAFKENEGKDEPNARHEAIVNLQHKQRHVHKLHQ